VEWRTTQPIRKYTRTTPKLVSEATKNELGLLRAAVGHIEGRAKRLPEFAARGYAGLALSRCMSQARVVAVSLLPPLPLAKIASSASRRSASSDLLMDAGSRTWRKTPPLPRRSTAAPAPCPA
jgi:hypothetical protein